MWAAAAAFAGWSIVLCGLRLAPVSVDQGSDLEGGVIFAAAFSVYWPALGITVLVVAVAVYSAITRAWTTAALVVSALTALWSAWALSQGYLMDQRPTLDTYVWTGLALAAAATLLAASARGGPRV
ncbi:hypothetical protein GCM10009641_33070 [Mycobacterium cookii]|uniref:Uncharacterized protein n=1 Tax=Nocardioides furvisabuli TaxID=375542 RepID=A0ABP5JDJ0_9ACTN|nr:hypothetical protein [Nocardioides furvisabuli]